RCCKTQCRLRRQAESEPPSGRQFRARRLSFSEAREENLMIAHLFPGLVFSTVLMAAATASAVEIKMVASNAVKEPYLELIPQYEKATGNKVRVDFVGTGDIVQRIGKNGEVADVIVGASFTIDDLIKQGRLAPGRVDLAKSIIGVALRPGAAKPDLSSGESLKS